MTKILLALLITGCVVGAGYVNGQLTYRWVPSHDPEEIQARYRAIPATVGDWDGSVITSEQTDFGAFGEGTLTHRRFKNRFSNNTVDVGIWCGRPLIMLTHSPATCYNSIGYSILDGYPKPDKVACGKSKDRIAEMFVGRFIRNSAVHPDYLQVLWAWSSDGNWISPEKPRITFASNRIIYKVYIITRPASADQPAETDPAREFANLFLPELSRVLFE